LENQEENDQAEANGYELSPGLPHITEMDENEERDTLFQKRRSSFLDAEEAV
jgi:hypothetical protein